MQNQETKKDSSKVVNPAGQLSPEFATKLALDAKNQQPSRNVVDGVMRGAGTIGFCIYLIIDDDIDERLSIIISFFTYYNYLIVGGAAGAAAVIGN